MNVTTRQQIGAALRWMRREAGLSVPKLKKLGLLDGKDMISADFYTAFERGEVDTDAPSDFFSIVECAINRTREAHQ